MSCEMLIEYPIAGHSMKTILDPKPSPGARGSSGWARVQYCFHTMTCCGIFYLSHNTVYLTKAIIFFEKLLRAAILNVFVRPLWMYFVGHCSKKFHVHTYATKQRKCKQSKIKVIKDNLWTRAKVSWIHSSKK